MKNVIITMEEPKVVAQADPSVHRWGPYQFPGLNRLKDGRIHINYHLHEDSATAYGKETGHAVFDEAAGRWVSLPQAEVPDNGYAMPNGDLIRPVHLRSVPEEEVTLPQAVVTKYICYVEGIKFFRPGQIPAEYDGWYYERQSAGGSGWTRAQLPAEEIMPGIVRDVREGVVPRPSVGRIINLKNGDSIMYDYYFFMNGEDDVLMRPWYLLSRDSGKTWKFLSTIPYDPDPARDDKAALRDGFTEPRTVQLADESLFTLMRTTDGRGIGPMYATRSADGGLTWEKPWVVDELGVLPAMLPLKNGVTLMSYGRPGLYLRGTADPACRELGDRITIVKPDPKWDTCAYTDLLPLSDDSAMLAYSDFNYPNPDGVPVKTVLTRVIHTRVEG